MAKRLRKAIQLRNDCRGAKRAVGEAERAPKQAERRDR
jgi:hypothetical protein